MMKDPTEFRQRFAAWKAKKKVYDAGKPISKYDGGKSIEDDYLPVVKYYTEKDLDKLFGIYNTPFVKDNDIAPFDQNDWNSSKNDPEMHKDLTEWINELMTDNKVTADGGELKNVVVTPTKEDKKILRLFKRAIPDKNVRNDIYEWFDKDLEWRASAGEKSNISQNERVKNLVSVWQMSKNPKMYNNVADKFITDSKLGTPRANYTPILNKFGNIANLDDYISELSHAYLFSPNADKNVRENMLSSFLNLPGDISINGKSGYERPGNLEHTAHSIIQPALKNFIMTEKHPSVLALNDRINKELQWLELLRSGSLGTKSTFFKSIKPLPKYDDGTDDKTYLPEYEYEATVTPQGTSLEKHKRITNEEDWLKYWGNVGAGYVNLAQEKAAPVILNGMSMLMGNPIGALTGIAGGIVGEDVGGNWSPTGRAIGGLVGGIALDPETLLALPNVINDVKMLPVLFKNGLIDYKYAKAISKIHPQEVKQLRAQHFLDKSGTALQKDGMPIEFYHGSPNKGITQLKHVPPQTGGRGTAEEGFYATPKRTYADRYRAKHLMYDVDFPVDQGEIYSLYANVQNPGYFDPTNPIFKDYDIGAFYHMSPEQRYDFLKLGYDGLELGYNLSMRGKRPEIVVLDNSLFKFADPIARNDDGGLIWLSLRDDFFNPDLRYDKGKSIHINPANKGKFNATKKRTGKTTEQLAHSKNPLTRKRAIFALNSRKFRH